MYITDGANAWQRFRIVTLPAIMPVLATVVTLLPPFWQALSHLNPIVYMISGFRFGFLGITDVPLFTTVAVLVVFIIVFYLLCWYLIQRGRGLRS